STIKDIPEVSKVTPENIVSDGVYQYVVEAKSKEDIRKRLFFALASAQCPILMMQNADMSLEDAFLRLTSETQYDNKKGGKKQ
ncbi:MAG: hypothetical protein LUH12_04260, partial [Bacteroides sp.]|nr:hypothetical protein [Bacteroides sp.]